MLYTLASYARALRGHEAQVRSLCACPLLPRYVLFFWLLAFVSKLGLDSRNRLSIMTL